VTDSDEPPTRALQESLAYACRVLAAHGQNDTIYGHVSVRAPGAETFWMKPATIGLDEMTPRLALLLDLAGNVLAGQGSRHQEWPIHSEIFRARPEVTCVVHTHPIYSIAFAATSQPLRPVSHEGSMFVPPDVPRFTQTSDLIVTPELGAALARTLGSAPACFLVNHGIVTVAESVAAAVVAAINLERASQVQLLAMAQPRFAFAYTPDTVSLTKRTKVFSARSLESVFAYYRRQIGPLPDDGD